MINSKDRPVEWALFLYELEDAKKHLNRAWHSNSTSIVGEISSAQWQANSQFPASLKFFED